MKRSYFRVVGQVQYDKNALASVIESKMENGTVFERYHIDASRGFICPLVQIYDKKTGKLTEEYTSSEFFFHEKTGSSGKCVPSQQKG